MNKDIRLYSNNVQIRKLQLKTAVGCIENSIHLAYITLSFIRDPCYSKSRLVLPSTFYLSGASSPG